jgi:hypothetical protein
VIISLQFPLDIEDDWPPFGSESLPFNKNGTEFELISPPLFVKGLSSGDIISVALDRDNFVCGWHYLKKSGNSTIWILRISLDDSIDSCLNKLREIGCNTVSMEDIGCFSVNVPENLSLSSIDDILESLNENVAAIAYPSLRHPE